MGERRASSGQIEVGFECGERGPSGKALVEIVRYMASVTLSVPRSGDRSRRKMGKVKLDTLMGVSEGKAYG